MRSFRLLAICVASVLALFAATDRAAAQAGGQGRFVTEASARLIKLIDAANKDGYNLPDNTFAVGGGWLKQGAEWVGLFHIKLDAGKQYRFLAAGDADATDVDVQVTSLDGTTVYKEDIGAAADAIVDFTPNTTQRYLVRVRLFASRNNLPCVCLAVVMAK